MRGKQLEKKIKAVCLKARLAKEALVLQIPTPMAFTAKGVIPQQSTVDYVGCLKGGTFIAFDAKETKSLTSFPLANIHNHQTEYLQSVEALGGVAFFAICFTSLDAGSVFILSPQALGSFERAHSRKSIPLAWLKANTPYKPINQII